jgi:hypothetical protein
VKVPKYIKEAIEKSSIYAMRQRENDKIVRDWLEKKGFSDMDEVIDDYVTLVENSVQHIEFIKVLERTEETK